MHLSAHHPGPRGKNITFPTRCPNSRRHQCIETARVKRYFDIGWGCGGVHTISIFCDALKGRKGFGLSGQKMLTVAPVLPPAPHSTPLHPRLLFSEQFEHLRVLDEAGVCRPLISLKVYAATLQVRQRQQSELYEVCRKLNF